VYALRRRRVQSITRLFTVLPLRRGYLLYDSGLKLKPRNLNPKPETLNPQPETRNLKP
jgi:hypothetical protein